MESMTMSDPVTTAAPAVHGMSPVDLFLQADSIVKTVMILLVLASAWGWAVILDKEIRLKILNRRADKLIKSIQNDLPLSQVAPSFAEASANDPLVQVYRAASDEYNRSAELIFTEAQRDAVQERVHRAANLASGAAIGHLQARLGSLATIGAVSPFVGLFGTVWGIMTSFQGIAASNNTSLAVVAPGIAEALFATALGLVAAIPAVIFYNRIGTDIGNYGKKLASFIGVFEIELSRSLSKKGERNGLRVA
jgi:biopolymer transport protein TolQ